MSKKTKSSLVKSLKHGGVKAVQKPGTASAAQAAPSPFAGKPLDGSQYLEVIEEQAYADQRPSAAEQKPRYSYLNPVPQPGRNK
jgi:hypothetical protein